MEALSAVLLIVVAIAVLYAFSVRVGVPYPALFVLGGLALAFIPGLPRVHLEPELILLVFLPPLLFIAAIETNFRELRENVAPITRLAFGLVIFTVAVVAVVAQAVVPTMGWAAAITLGAIVAPTDAIAATSVFRRIGTPRVVTALIEGEALFNDATALVIYRTAVAIVAGGSKVGFKVLQKKNQNPAWVKIVGFDPTTDREFGLDECLSGEVIEIDVPRGATNCLNQCGL